MAKIYVFKTCVVCGKESPVEVDVDKFADYVEGRRLGLPSATHSVQVLFPELSADEREILISGTHPECWNKMFGSDDDE